MVKTLKQDKRRTTTKAKDTKGKKPKKSVKSAKATGKKTKIVTKAKAAGKTLKKAAKKTVKKIVKKTEGKAAKKTVKKAAKKSTKGGAAKTKKVVAKKSSSSKVSKSKQSKAKVAASKPAIGIAIVDIAPYKPKKTEKYMSAKMRAHFCSILTAWKQQLMEEVDRTVSHLQGEAANFPDPSDRATQEEVFSLELRTRDRERKLIRKIEEALQMIDSDEYGYCMCCGEEIGLRRLEARPTAKLCIDCKTLDEIRERQEGI